MDTDYLTEMAYNCIRLANEASDVLKSELGAMCSRFETEDAYLKGILRYVKRIERDPEGYLDCWNLLDDIDLEIFAQRVKILREYIDTTIATPIKDRGKPAFP